MYDIDKSELENTLKNFYNVTKFMIVLFDSNRKVLYSYPKSMCEFCTSVRQNKILENKCFECDNIGFDICDKTRKPYIYKCHMNVIEAISPIYANEVNIGYMMFGQIIEKASVDVYEKAKKLLRNTDSAISQISQDVGISDTNYFIRVFKQLQGITPAKYRNNIRKSKQ